jgi:serine/threonine-protein kinase
MEQRLGSRYRLEDVLGRGGSGEVWRGTGPDGPVAVKLLRPELSTDPDIVDRFVAERSLLIDVQSPHIVTVHDLVIEGERLAIVMDLVTGGDLRSRLRNERTLRPLTAVDLTVQVLEGIAAVHAAGIVHRDLKPENLLLDEQNGSSVRVADFGIARLSSSSRATRTTGLLGTPRYVAPELSIRGRVTPAVDVYAAGVTFYEMLFGRVPFDGPHPAAVLRAHAEDEPYRPDDVPDALWAVILRMLAKNPADRPTATEAAAQLRALRADVVTLPTYPALARSGGPDTDATYTTDPHGNATDLTGIGRRGGRHVTTGVQPPAPARRRWLVPAVAIVGAVAVVGTVALSGQSSTEEAAPAYSYDGTSQQTVTASQHWTFGSSRGDEINGTMDVRPTKDATFTKDSSVTAVFPASFTHLAFDPGPSQRQQFRQPAAGSAGSASVTAVRFALPVGKHTFSVRYHAQVPPAGTSADRFDRWAAEMDEAFAQLCTGDSVPSICPADRTSQIAFSTAVAPAIGPGQTFDANLVLEGSTTSGIKIDAGKVPGAAFTGDNPSVATVSSSGKVTAVAPGQVHVLARLGSLRSPAPLTIEVAAAPVPVVTRLQVTGPATISGQQQYVVHAFADDGSEQPVLVAWSVSPPASGTIDANGVFTPVQGGRSVTINAATVNALGKRVTTGLRVQLRAVDLDPDHDGVKGAADYCPLVPGDAADHGCAGVNPPVVVISDPPPPTVKPPIETPPPTPGPTQAPLPDLIVTSISIPDGTTAGDCVPFSVGIKNIGPGASPDVKHGVLLYLNGSRLGMPWSDSYRTGLAPGASRVQVTNAGRGDLTCDPSGGEWRAVAGTFTVQAWVDDHEGVSGDGLIEEVDGSNNRLSVTITVPPASAP